MPKRYQQAAARPHPIQLALFADAASLTCIRPEINEGRFYRLEVWPDLFGRALLMRQWGRIGSEAHRRLDPHPNAGAAQNALGRLFRRNAAAAIRTACHDPAACSQGRQGEASPCPAGQSRQRQGRRQGRRDGRCVAEEAGTRRTHLIGRPQAGGAGGTGPPGG